MNKPRHSFSGYRRLMQTSRKTLFIFIEGYKDRYIYSKITESACQPHSINYQVVTAAEFTEGTGGKEALLEFFTYLKRQSSLINKFQGKTTVSVFFLDKDVDDFLRIRRHSKHIIYTGMYHLENYLFIHGKLSEAAAATSLLDIGSTRAGLGESTVWRKRAAENWKTWIKLCLFSRARGAKSISNYKQKRSQINDGVYGPVKEDEYLSRLSTLQRQSGMQTAQFQRSFTRLSRKVDRLYSMNQYDLVFKGRWYACFLADDIKRISDNRRFDHRRLEKRILSNLQLTLDFNDLWVEKFKSPIRRLLAEADI